jgi:hypothetical protein
MGLRDILKRLKDQAPKVTDDEDSVEARSRAFQSENDPNGKAPEEAGLEDGSYLPGGAEDLLPTPGAIAGKITKAADMVKAAKGAGELMSLEKYLKDGTKLLYAIPRELYAKLKNLGPNELKPYLKEVSNPAVGAGRADSAMTKTWATTGKMPE